MKKAKMMLGSVLLGLLLSLTAAADSFSPATGEHANPLPWILGGIGLVAVVAVVVLTVLDAKRKNAAPPPPPADPNNGDGGDDWDSL